MPFLALFARDRDKVVTTDTSRTGLEITTWQKQTDITIQPIAFASRYLNDSKDYYSIQELELFAVVWKPEESLLNLYVEVVNVYTDNQFWNH